MRPLQDVSAAGASQDISAMRPPQDGSAAGASQDISAKRPPQDGSAAGLSPEVIRPLPKAKAWRANPARGRKLRTVILTDTPEKCALEGEQK